MKKVAVFILMLIASAQLFAQHYGEYSLSLNKDKAMQILLKDGEDYILRLQAHHSYSDDVFFQITGTKELIKLNTSLKNLKQKFTEYSATAKENNVREYSKVLDFDLCKVTLLWYSTHWYSGANSKPNVYLLIKEGQCCINIHKKSASRSNQYITEEGNFFLLSEEDFDTLISITDINEIQNKLSKNLDVLFN